MQKSQTTMVAVDNDVLACMKLVAERTGVSVGDVVSNANRQWYDLSFDAPASHIRWEIAEGKKRMANYPVLEDGKFWIEPTPNPTTANA
jgi:hypothetical protein